MSIAAIRKALGLVKLVGPIDWIVAKARCKELIVEARKSGNDSKAADYSAIKEEIKKYMRPKHNRCMVCNCALSTTNRTAVCAMHSPRRMAMREYFNKERSLIE